MTDVQKVSICKYCQGEITWSTDPVTGKNSPKNLSGTPHLCQKNAQKPVIETATQIAQEKEEYNRKAQAAGFQTGAHVHEPVTPQGDKIDCTSSKTPVGGFWNVLGVVETIDVQSRKATVSDEAGIIHPIMWSAGYIDEKFAKLKPGYYRKFSGEANNPDIVTAVGWMGKDEPEWVKARYKALHPSGSGGGWKGQPRNERIIVVECMLKAYCDLWCNTNTPDQITFADAREEILAAVEADLPRVMKAGGL